MEIVGEYLSLGYDKRIWEYFCKHWSTLFPNLGCRTSFTRQCANLSHVKKCMQEKISKDICSDQDLYICDGFPIPVAHIKRYKRSDCFKPEGSS